MVLRRWRWLLLFCLVPSVSAAKTPDARYERTRDAYLALKEDPERQKFRHHYLKILDAFEEFVEDHPTHPKAPAALYNGGHLSWDLYRVSRVRGDLERAGRLFRRLADEYADDRLADDGLFLAGRILLEHGGDKTEAWRLFDATARRFPDGDMSASAREMTARLADYRPAEPAAAEKTSAKMVARTTAWRGSAEGEAAAVGPVKTWSNEDTTRVAVYLSRAVSWRQAELPADPERDLPRRFYVDLRPAQLGEGATEAVQVGDGLLTQVRSGQFSPDTVRVVLDVDQMREARVLPLTGPDRLVIDVVGGTAPTPAAAPAAETEADLPNLARVKQGLSRPAAIPLSVQAGLKIRRVVVDAGHGGHDKGAVGPGGLQEKDVALDIAKRVGRLLTEAGLEVVYTRTDDVFIPLEERTAIANTVGADLFISVHANAHPRRDRRGVSTYYLDLAHDRYSVRLAALENATSEKSVSDLQFILADLAKQSNVDDSARLARHVQEATVATLGAKYSSIRDLGVKYALFYVLLGAKMPAVLVETSFISNPAEEKRLKNEQYRVEVAKGIVAGIDAFIEDRKTVALGK